MISLSILFSNLSNTKMPTLPTLCITGKLDSVFHKDGKWQILASQTFLDENKNKSTTKVSSPGRTELEPLEVFIYTHQYWHQRLYYVKTKNSS